eukprot:scpid39234/ scgid11867/ FGGY carbohydrate kinase domain-containing protein
MATDLFLGIDVGSQSARAVLVDVRGKVLSTAERAVSVFVDPSNPNIVEQSAAEIWQACVEAATSAISSAQQSPQCAATGRPAGDFRECVRGVGFTSTCSTLVLDADCHPQCVSPAAAGNPHHDVIMWMDHRGEKQAAAARHSSKLREVSADAPDPFWLTAERHACKLLWLKENMPDVYAATAHVLDLSDWLVMKATGASDSSFPRSLCALTAKFNYRHDDNRAGVNTAIAAAQGWPRSAYAAAGLEDHVADDFQRLGQLVQRPGTAVGQGLCAEAARAFGLVPGTAVSASLIDAHAGALGVLGVSVGESTATAAAEEQSSEGFCGRAALICGTSTCLMVGKASGPGCYIMPAGWVHESGQSAVGDLLHHIVSRHAAVGQLDEYGDGDVFTRLNRYVLQLGGDQWPLLAADVHVLPDFRGNRAPLGDDSIRGMISGLSLDSGLESLARVYVATLIGLALGVRFIFDSIARRDEADTALPELLIACGGVALKNELYLQAHTDAVSMPVAVASEKESVALGAAMLGAAASGTASLSECMKRMAPRARLVRGCGCRDFFTRKYAVYLGLLSEQRKCQRLMQASDTGVCAAATETLLENLLS